MDTWKPKDFADDPMVNAVLNVAAAIEHLASATNGLFYGLKYSKDQGTSIAEAIENAGAKIAAAIPEPAEQ